MNGFSRWVMMISAPLILGALTTALLVWKNQSLISNGVEANQKHTHDALALSYANRERIISLEVRQLNMQEKQKEYMNEIRDSLKRLEDD